MTVASADILLVHAPKTGGTWAAAALRLARGAYELIGSGHDPYSAVGAEWRAGRLAVGTVRDPWSWYPSIYFHAMDAGDTERRALVTYGGGVSVFRDVLYGMTHPTPGRVPDRVGVIFQLGEPAGLLASGRGLASYVQATIYEGVGHFVDQANLNEGMAILLGADRDRLNQIRRANSMKSWSNTYAKPPRGRPVSSLYDDEMLAWVAEADADWIDRFAFLPFGRARRATNTARPSDYPGPAAEAHP